MRRGAKPEKDKVEAKLPLTRKLPKNDGARVRDLEKRLAEALAREAKALTELQTSSHEVAEAHEQLRATSEILRVISSSTADLQPVLDTVTTSAARLCEASDASIYSREGERLVLVANHGAVDIGPIGEFSLSLSPDTVAGRAVLEGRTIHVTDLQAEGTDFLESRDYARRMGHRTILSVPLMREGVAIGAIALRRTEAQLFTERQVTLLETFTAQAVIAIANARLFNETKEALERQTATAEILRVISSSPTDVAPVFATIIRSAVQLSGARRGALLRFDGELVHLVAHHNQPAEALVSLERAYPMRPSRVQVSGRAILSRAVAEIHDVRNDPEYLPGMAAEWELGSVLGVPMLRADGTPTGVIAIQRSESGPFAVGHIELLKTFADQAVIAIENVRLFTELQEKNRALTQAHAQVTEALEQQTATADILSVISSSPTDLQPTMDVVAERAARLCVSLDAHVFVRDGDLLRHVGHHGSIPTEPTMPLIRGTANGRAVLDGRIVHVGDLQIEADEFPEGSEIARRLGHRTVLIVPLMRDDVAIGAIAVRRTEARLFTERQVALLQTFADQAVIAIENVRLFRELEARNRDLTATAQILQVISRSPTDVQPVFEAIADSAFRLFEAQGVAVVRYDGELISMAAARGGAPGSAVAATERFREPHPPMVGFPPEQTVLTKTMHHVADVDTDPSCSNEFRRHARERGFRSVVSIPMLRAGDPVGVIVISRVQPGAFHAAEIELLKTFADQAVIAIENVRLFTELQDKNRALTEALDQQTATSDILRVISSSPTDAQPVFDTIVRSATRLCRARAAAVFVTDGPMLYEPANYGGSPEVLAATRARYPRPLDRETAAGTAILTRSVVQVPDVEEPSAAEFAEFARRVGRAVGFRSLLSVPMLREGEAVGAINITRPEPGRFSDAELALLKTFADQAVIAIENVRLFKALEARTQDLTRSVGELRALGEVGQAISSTLDLDTVLETIVTRAVQLSGADAGSIYEYDERTGELSRRAVHNMEAEILARPDQRFRRGEGALGQAVARRQPVQFADISDPAVYESKVRDLLLRFGYRALLAVPLVREDQIIGALVVNRKAPGEFPQETVALLTTVATQSALAIQNARLFREIADKSRQLEAASQHKSEFLANMSHELRTPLNAIIGFSEVLGERLFGELNEKQEEYLKDIHASGQHLLSLINDILDLSKIEAGRMELELAEFHLPQAIENALVLVRERALRRGITLEQSIDQRLGQIQGDERKIKQVLLNLLSNAIKFTPDGGRIEVRAIPVDRSVEVSVSDTGVGIAPEDQEAIFEEFRQVGTAEKKVEGTGLGLALSRKFIELHGGRIWVESQIGAGSTFTFTIPIGSGA